MSATTSNSELNDSPQHPYVVVTGYVFDLAVHYAAYLTPNIATEYSIYCIEELNEMCKFGSDLTGAVNASSIRRSNPQLVRQSRGFSRFARVARSV
jgi:hypothetical protein